MPPSAAKPPLFSCWLHFTPLSSSLGCRCRFWGFWGGTPSAAQRWRVEVVWRCRGWPLPPSVPCPQSSGSLTTPGTPTSSQAVGVQPSELSPGRGPGGRLAWMRSPWPAPPRAAELASDSSLASQRGSLGPDDCGTITHSRGSPVPWPPILPMPQWGSPAEAQPRDGICQSAFRHSLLSAFSPLPTCHLQLG